MSIISVRSLAEAMGLPSSFSVRNDLLKVGAGNSVVSLRERLLPLREIVNQIAALPHHNYIKLRIRKIRCESATTPSYFADDLAIGGVAIYPDFSTKLIPVKRLGEYDTGQTKDDVLDKLVGMTLNKPATFSTSIVSIKLYVAILLVAEMDAFEYFSDILDELHSLVKRVTGEHQVNQEIVNTIDENLDPFDFWSSSSIATFVDAVDFIWSVASLMGAAVFETISNYGGGPWDDIFRDPTMVGYLVWNDKFLNVTSAGIVRTDSKNETKTVSDHGGEYKLTFDWKLYN